MITGERVNNVYVIDTKMFGFTGWNTAYLVAGEKVALIDTGPATSAEVVRAGILKHGFALRDISYIFITHIHLDHSGSAGILLKEMPEAKVIVHPRVAKHLIDPSIMMENMRKEGGEKMAARFGELLPISASRVQPPNDGDVIDLGNNEKLRVIFAPGHATSHMVFWEEKNKGLFIGDAPGIYIADGNILVIPSPFGSDLRQAMETLKMLIELQATKLYFGHFGVCTMPKETLERALAKMQQYWDIATEMMREGKPNEIVDRIIAINSKEVEKLTQMGGGGLHEYLTEELIPMWARGFAAYYQKQQQRSDCSQP